MASNTESRIPPHTHTHSGTGTPRGDDSGAGSSAPTPVSTSWAGGTPREGAEGRGGLPPAAHSAGFLESVLEQLDGVAEDRIRDAKAAKTLLGTVIKAVKAVRRDALAVPVERIVRRLCYFANARDTAIRSATFRAVRYVVVSPDDVACLTRSRMIISLVRSLEREPRYLWERIQALKVVRAIMELAPAQMPLAILRSLVAIATFVAEPAAATPVRGAPTGAGGPRHAQGRPGGDGDGAGAHGLDDAAGAAPQEDDGRGPTRSASTASRASPAAAGAAAAAVDNLRRVVLDMLRLGCLSPVMLPLMASCGAVDALADALLELAASPADQDVCASILLTMIRLVADPGSRRYVPPSRVMRAIVSAFTLHVAEVPVTAAHRVKWAAARHMLVTFARTWAGMYALASDCETLESLVAILMTCQNPELLLATAGLFMELLCPPAVASDHGIHELSGLAPAARRLARRDESFASSGLTEDGFAQSLAVSYAAHVTRMAAAPMHAGHSMHREQSYADSEHAAGPHGEALNSAMLAGLVSGDVSAPQAGEGDSTMSARLPAYLRPVGFAVPFFAAESRHELADVPEYYAAYWLRLGDVSASSNVAGAPVAVGGPAERDDVQAISKQAAARLGAPLDDVWLQPFELARPVLSAAVQSPWPLAAVTPTRALHAYQAHMLAILLKAGLARGCLALSLRAHPIVRIAGISLLKWVVAQSMHLLPAPAMQAIWALPDLTQLAAYASARTFLPAPQLHVHLQRPATFSREQLSELLQSYSAELHTTGRPTAARVTVLSAPLAAGPGSALHLTAFPTTRQHHVWAALSASAISCLQSRVPRHRASSAQPSILGLASGRRHAGATVSRSPSPLHLTGEGTSSAPASPKTATAERGEIAEAEMLTRPRRPAARGLEPGGKLVTPSATRGATQLTAPFTTLHRNAVLALDMLTATLPSDVGPTRAVRISRHPTSEVGASASDLGFDVVQIGAAQRLQGQQSMLTPSAFATRHEPQDASTRLHDDDRQFLRGAFDAYTPANVGTGVGVYSGTAPAPFHWMAGATGAATAVAGRMVLSMQDSPKRPRRDSGQTSTRGNLVAVAHFGTSIAASAVSQALTVLRTVTCDLARQSPWSNARLQRESIEGTLRALIRYASENIATPVLDTDATQSASQDSWLVRPPPAGVAMAALLLDGLSTFVQSVPDTHPARAGTVLLYYALASTAVVMSTVATKGQQQAGVTLRRRGSTLEPSGVPLCPSPALVAMRREQTRTASLRGEQIAAPPQKDAGTNAVDVPATAIRQTRVGEEEAQQLSARAARARLAASAGSATGQSASDSVAARTPDSALQSDADAAARLRPQANGFAAEDATGPSASLRVLSWGMRPSASEPHLSAANERPPAPVTRSGAAVLPDQALRPAPVVDPVRSRTSSLEGALHSVAGLFTPTSKPPSRRGSQDTTWTAGTPHATSDTIGLDARGAPAASQGSSKLSSLVSGLTRGFGMAFTPRQERAGSTASLTHDLVSVPGSGIPDAMPGPSPYPTVQSHHALVPISSLHDADGDPPADAALPGQPPGSRPHSADAAANERGTTDDTGRDDTGGGSGLSRVLARAAAASRGPAPASAAPPLMPARGAGLRAGKKIVPVEGAQTDTEEISMHGHPAGPIALTAEQARRRRHQFQLLKLGLVSHVREDERWVDWEEHLSDEKARRNNLTLLTEASRRLGVQESVASVLCVLRRLQLRVAQLPITFALRVGEGSELVVPPSVVLSTRDADRAKLHVNDPRRANCSSTLCGASVASGADTLYDRSLRVPDRPGARPMLSNLLRAQVWHGMWSGRGSSTSQGGAALGAASRMSFSRERDLGVAAQVSTAFSIIRVSKVLAAKDWRMWDWGTIAVVLDHHLTSTMVLGEVLVKTQFMQRLGEFFAHIGGSEALNGSGSLASLPWLPATVRFVRAARQWLLLCLHHPLGRDLLRHRGPKGAAEGTSQGLAAEIAISLWCQLSRTFKRIVRANGIAAKGAGTPSSAAGRFFASATSRARAALTGASMAPAAETAEQAAASLVKDCIGTSSGEPHAAAFSRATFTTTLARELFLLIGTLLSTPAGCEILTTLKASRLYALPDAPDHAGMLSQLLQSSTTESLNVALRHSDSSFVVSLIHLGGHRSRDYLARHLLGCLNFNEDGPARILLRAWLFSYLPGPSGRTGSVDSVGSPALDASGQHRGLSVSKSLALYSTCFLRALLRQGVSAFADWGIDLLCTQLRHPDADIARAALSILTEAALRSRVYLLAIVARNPQLAAFELSATLPLCILLLAEPSGCALMIAQGLVHPILENWLSVDHIRAVMMLEDGLRSTFMTNGMMLDAPLNHVTGRDARIARTADNLLPRVRGLHRMRPSAAAVRAILAVHGSERLDTLYRDPLWSPASDARAPMGLDRVRSLAWMRQQASSVARDVASSSLPRRDSVQVARSPRWTRGGDQRRTASSSPRAQSAGLQSPVLAATVPRSTVPVTHPAQRRLSRHSHHGASLSRISTAAMGVDTVSNAAPGASPLSGTPTPLPTSPGRPSQPRTVQPPSPQPWPIPLVLPTHHSSAAGEELDATQPLFAQLARGNPHWAVRLDSLVQLPWRVEVWAEWEKQGTGFGLGEMTAGLDSEASMLDHDAPQIMRMEIPCDTFVDLSAFSPEMDVTLDGNASSGTDSTSAMARPPCDGFIRAVCVDMQGTPQPFVVPPTAVIKAALYCGVHPVSSLGDIPCTAADANDHPATHGTASSSTPTPTRIFAYDDVEGAIEALASGSQWDAESPSRRTSRLEGAAEPHAHRERSRHRSTDDRRRGGRRSALSAHAEVSDTEDAGTSDDGRSERSAVSARSRVAVDSSITPAMSHRSTAATPVALEAEFSSSIGGAPNGRVELAQLDDAAGRLRRRNAAAVGSLCVDVQRRHAHAWAAECGVVNVEGGVEVKASSLNCADAVFLPGTSASSAVVSVTKLPDFVSGGPEANTIVVGGSILATHTPAQAGAMMRAAGDRHARWASCNVAAVHMPDSSPTGRGGTPSVRMGSPSLRSTNIPAAASRLDQHAVCPPGSHARFVFSSTALAPGAVRLDAVDFGFVLLPKRPAHQPLPLDPYSALSAHREGIEVLRAARHVPALVAVGFDDHLIRDAPPMAMDSSAVESLSLQRRAALWSLATICSSPVGYDLVLEDCPDIVLRFDAAARGLRIVRHVHRRGESEVNMRYTAVVAHEDDSSIRATAQLCLALLVRHERGCRDVTAYGWWVTREPQHAADRLPTLAVLTTQLPSLIVIPHAPTAAYTLYTPELMGEERPPTPEPLDDVEREDTFLAQSRLPPKAKDWDTVLMRVTELCSRISQKDARTALIKLRTERPDLFASSGLYMHVHGLLSRYNMALPVRRFVHFLFERVSFSDRAWETAPA